MIKKWRKWRFETQETPSIKSVFGNLGEFAAKKCPLGYDIFNKIAVMTLFNGN